MIKHHYLLEIDRAGEIIKIPLQSDTECKTVKEVLTAAFLDDSTGLSSDLRGFELKTWEKVNKDGDL